MYKTIQKTININANTSVNISSEKARLINKGSLSTKNFFDNGKQNKNRNTGNKKIVALFPHESALELIPKCVGIISGKCIYK